MNCPHCHWRIDDAVVIKAAASLNAKKDRPGAKGLVRNPKGRPKKETKFFEEDAPAIDVLKRFLRKARKETTK